MLYFDPDYWTINLLNKSWRIFHTADSAQSWTQKRSDVEYPQILDIVTQSLVVILGINKWKHTVEMKWFWNLPFHSNDEANLIMEDT